MSEQDHMPWDQQRDETDLEFGHFQIWLKLRPRPESRDPMLAVRHNWHARATAFDAFERLGDLDPRESAIQIFRRWSWIIDNETFKWFKKSFSEEGVALDPTKISDFIAFVTDPARNQAGSPNYAIDGLTPEELAVFLPLLEKAKVLK